MATIMERIALIVRSEASDFAARHEDAEKTINQAIADAMVSYTGLRRELEPVAGSEAQARERLDALADEARRWHEVARRALLAGNEDDARTALSREQDLKRRIAAQQDIYDQIHETADALRRQLAEMEDGINQLQAKMARVKAKQSVARATDAATGVAGGVGTLDRLEDEADRRLSEAEGRAEAAEVAAGDPFADLEPEVDDASVDEQLAALYDKIRREG